MPAQTIELPSESPLPPVLTNVAQLQASVSLPSWTNRPVRLEGLVCWADAGRGRLVLQDQSGAASIKVEPPAAALRAGQRIVLQGTESACWGSASVRIGDLFLAVDHPSAAGQKSGSVFLRAGKQPIEVNWLAGDEFYGLEVLYDGTNVARSSIPDSVLFYPRTNRPAGVTSWAPGVTYRTYEGRWSEPPDFGKLSLVKQGLAPNFNLELRTRDHYAGIEFSGSLDIKQDGAYAFYIVPRGFDQSFVRQAHLGITGLSEPPSPRQMLLGQSCAGPPQWAQVEGTVTFVTADQGSGLRLQLASGASHMDAEIAEAAEACSVWLLNSRVRLTGIVRGSYSLEGQSTSGIIRVPSLDQVEGVEAPPELWRSQPIVSISRADAAGPLVHLRGKVRSLGPGPLMVIEDGTGELAVHTAQPLPQKTGDEVEVVGVRARLENNQPGLRIGFYRRVERMDADNEPLPVLATAEAVKHMRREDALRGYPVKIRGVITWSGGSGAVIQDATMGVFVDEFKTEDSSAQRVGEFWEIEGRTTAQFSPMVRAVRAVRLGEGSLPDPVQATWDQLINGTLDTQFVEIQGVVTAVGGTGLSLLSRGGEVHVLFPEKRASELKPYENALVRVRGCLWAVKDEVSHAIKIGEVQMHDASIEVDHAAPADPFAAPLKRPPDLLLFDPQASPFQRVLVAGQVVHEREGDYYLMDGTNGLRFTLRTPAPVRIGARVQVAGFPALGSGPALMVREAVLRTTGQSPLPAPRILSQDTPFSKGYDSTRVRTRAQLVSLGLVRQDQVLGLQMGSCTFVARLNANCGFLEAVPVGSRLELTGVYVGRGGGRIADSDVDSFELLLNSPADVLVLARPPWWTIKRMLVMVALLAGVLVIAFVWIRLLQRQVELRTVQLRNEIEERERFERRHAIEEERSRIARDLHDDLGSSLTEISLLADAGAGRPPSLEKALKRFRTIESRARRIVGALDVIVWLVNPEKNQLQFLVSYLVSYAEEYVSAAGIACRVRVPASVPQLFFPAEVRQSLFLAMKEVLHNVVRHSKATEVMLEISLNDQELGITISDNGCGFDISTPAEGNGLHNLQKRLTDLGGRCDIAAQPGKGTRLSLLVPLPQVNEV
jgi:signal transduction histidine kinase